MVDLPLAVPVFQLLLPRDGGFHCREYFKQHEPLDIVFLAMPVEISFAMLADAFHQVRCHADVERPIIEAAHDVDTGLKIEAFGHAGSKFCMVVRGFSNVRRLRKIKMLKQVQHDGVGVEPLCLYSSMSPALCPLVTLSSPSVVTLNLFQGLNSGHRETVRNGKAMSNLSQILTNWTFASSL